MTADRLDAIEARANAATGGPWDWDHGNPRRILEGKGGKQVLSCAVLLYPVRDNAEFIANARADVPYLLALARKQQAAIERVEARMDEWAAMKPFPDADEMQIWYSAGKRHASEAIRALIREALEATP